jgi:3-oxoacyl-[acyl-carrier-protein] synthase II
MRVALKDAGLTANDISYVNAHATSTPNGDLAEMNALHSLFATSGSSANDLFVSSTKGSTGHLLGAAGAVEGAFTCLALQSNMLPPTLNLKEPVVPSALAIDACDDSKPSGNSSKEEVRNIRHVTQTGHLLPTDGRLTHAISNSFGFGGTNASLVFKKWAA